MRKPAGAETAWCAGSGRSLNRKADRQEETPDAAGILLCELYAMCIYFSNTKQKKNSLRAGARTAGVKACMEKTEKILFCNYPSVLLLPISRLMRNGN